MKIPASRTARRLRHAWPWLFTLAASAAAAQAFPNKPVTLVTGYPPGGGSDATARALAQELSELWKQPVIVESKPGAGTTISAAYVAKAPADGYTLLLATTALATGQFLFKNLSYDYLGSLTPASLVAESPFVLVARPGLNAPNLASLIALAKDSPQSLNFGSAGIGSMPHLAGAWLNTLTGAKSTHVPFQGTAPAVTALAGNQIDYLFADTSVLPFLASGRVKGLAVTGPKRVAQLSGLPTMNETFPEFNITVWAALEAPAATPREVLANINAAVQTALKSPRLLQIFGTLSQDARGSTLEEAAAFKAEQMQRFKKLIEQTGTKLD